MCFNSSTPSVPAPAPLPPADPAPKAAPSPLPPPAPLEPVQEIEPVKMGSRRKGYNDQQAAKGTSSLRIPLGSSSQSGGGINVG